MVTRQGLLVPSLPQHRMTTASWRHGEPHLSAAPMPPHPSRSLITLAWFPGADSNQRQGTNTKKNLV
ncbi:hypothetical protein E2C01_042877 [Portunus trituberculatus]|uniref:Uncharacterized protein n=1 Tax=Portunus trituberculatus TaxID=210409 RepID=A0A5B7FVU0_PORTR|nr:hypothetical protein [Portunus trituberculatus]